MLGAANCAEGQQQQQQQNRPPLEDHELLRAAGLFLLCRAGLAATGDGPLGTGAADAPPASTQELMTAEATAAHADWKHSPTFCLSRLELVGATALPATGCVRVDYAVAGAVGLPPGPASSGGVVGSELLEFEPPSVVELTPPRLTITCRLWPPLPPHPPPPPARHYICTSFRTRSPGHLASQHRGRPAVRRCCGRRAGPAQRC